MQNENICDLNIDCRNEIIFPYAIYSNKLIEFHNRGINFQPDNRKESYENYHESIRTTLWKMNDANGRYFYSILIIYVIFIWNMPMTKCGLELLDNLHYMNSQVEHYNNSGYWFIFAILFKLETNLDLQK